MYSASLTVAFAYKISSNSNVWQEKCRNGFQDSLELNIHQDALNTAPLVPLLNRKKLEMNLYNTTSTEINTKKIKISNT